PLTRRLTSFGATLTHTGSGKQDRGAPYYVRYLFLLS
ncbi:MAG: hypothetical protein QOD40_2516, partial [Alphaproteobacteria bacterium]|nr:hypothetical protein [Alphaproteobacteria bacterium]